MHLSLQRCQQETTATEFHKWQLFLAEQKKDEIERTEKWEHYIAKVCALIRACWGGDKNATVEQDIIKFKCTIPILDKPVKVTKEQRVKEARSFWDMFFGVHKVIGKRKM